MSINWHYLKERLAFRWSRFCTRKETVDHPDASHNLDFLLRFPGTCQLVSQLTIFRKLVSLIRLSLISLTHAGMNTRWEDSLKKKLEDKNPCWDFCLVWIMEDSLETLLALYWMDSIDDHCQLTKQCLSINLGTQECRESNPGQLREKRKRYLCAMPTPRKPQLIPACWIFWPCLRNNFRWRRFSLPLHHRTLAILD